MTTALEDGTPIRGGIHIKTRDDGVCIHVMRMLYNWRLVLAVPDVSCEGNYIHGWCYYGHGVKDGRERDMETALITAALAAAVWDGYGSPHGFDKKAL